MNSEEGMQQVKDEISQALNKGIAGVPHFTINNKFELSGGQEPKVWLETFEKISKE